MQPDKPAERGAQPIPVIQFDERKAAMAYEAHIALIDQERRFPELKQNAAWKMLRADAFEQFANAFAGEA